MTQRQIVLDTETTGLDPKKGHRIIEIGCVEIIERRVTENYWHYYLNPDRDIDAGAQQVHGITSEFLEDKPRFYELKDDFLKFISGAELIIHNAKFDLGFLNHELRMVKWMTPIEQQNTIIDTLTMARERHPGQRNNLDALCSRYQIDNSKRDLHGALLDSEILARVYLAMTGGQINMFSDEKSPSSHHPQAQRNARAKRPDSSLRVIKATPDELKLHENYFL